MKKETRITLIVVAGCVVLGLAAISAWSGAEVDFMEALKTLVTAAISGGAGWLARGK